MDQCLDKLLKNNQQFIQARFQRTKKLTLIQGFHA